MKTRKKEIDVKKLLGVSSRSKNIPNKAKELSSRKKTNTSSSSNDVSDKENSSSRPLKPTTTTTSRDANRILSPLKANVSSLAKKTTERNLSKAILSPLSVQRAIPEATSTPNIVRRSLFPVDVAPVGQQSVQEDADPIVLSDSDCTDTEIDGENVSAENKENTGQNDKPKRRRRRKLIEMEPAMEILTSKRQIRPTLKAINSPSIREFHAKPRFANENDENRAETAPNPSVPATNAQKLKPSEQKSTSKDKNEPKIASPVEKSSKTPTESDKNRSVPAKIGTKDKNSTSKGKKQTEISSLPKSPVQETHERTTKRLVKPTLKALNSPSMRNYVTKPRTSKIDEQISNKNDEKSSTSAIKSSKKRGRPRKILEADQNQPEISSLPEQLPEIPSENIPSPTKRGRKPKPQVTKPANNDTESMPAPLNPVKRTRKVGKRVVRLYSEPKPVPKVTEAVPKYRLELEKEREIREGSGFGDDDIYNFHPSQESIEAPEENDSYIKDLIKKLKKRRKPGPKRGKITKKIAKEDEKEAPSEQKTKVESVMDRIRQKISEKTPSRTNLRPEIHATPHEKTVSFALPDVSVSENVPSAKKTPASHVTVRDKTIGISPISRDSSMLPLPMSSPMLNRSPNINPKRSSMLLPPSMASPSPRIIRNPVPGTSTGGWTPSGSNAIRSSNHSTPNQRLSRSIVESSVNKSINSPQSPWRVNDEARIPRTKYFSLSKDMLPTYSSDVIVRDTIPFVPEDGATNDSLNNSNAENVAPPEKRTPATKSHPAKRVPLGAIDVTDLYPAAMPEKHKPVTQSPLVRHSLTPRQLEKPPEQKRKTQIQIISDVPVTGPQYQLQGNRLIRPEMPDIDEDSNDSCCSANSNVSECFGFDVSTPPDEDLEVIPAVSDKDLKEKLKKLKEVFPLEKSVSQDVDMPVLFKSPMKQTNTLKTMLEAKTPKQRKEESPKAAVRVVDSSSDSEVEEASKKMEEEKTETENDAINIKLFDDPEPLRVKQVPVATRRSYAGRQKRRRKHYSDYETSDESELDDEDDDSDKHKHKRRKREKPDVEKTQEFQQFVSEFNSMCDEVEKYELVVEPIE
ncbi:protein dalmatian [Culicoides brevitarsis]|uniref:protein dalmatian n=1 Tax=Culicoides brevitarsis TaxID=469753 RepID=UPI00307C9BC9